MGAGERLTPPVRQIVGGRVWGVVRWGFDRRDAGVVPSVSESMEEGCCGCRVLQDGFAVTVAVDFLELVRVGVDSLY